MDLQVLFFFGACPVLSCAPLAVIESRSGCELACVPLLGLVSPNMVVGAADWGRLPVLVWGRASCPIPAPSIMSMPLRTRFAGPRSLGFVLASIIVVRGCSRELLVGQRWECIRCPVVPGKGVHVETGVGIMLVPWVVRAAILRIATEICAVRLTGGPEAVWHEMLGVGSVGDVVPFGNGMRHFCLVGTHSDARGLWHLWGDDSSRRSPVQKEPAFTLRAGGGVGFAWRPNEFLSMEVLGLAPHVRGRCGLDVLGWIPVAI